MSIYPATNITSYLVNTVPQQKIVYLPAASTVQGRTFFFKDICGNAAVSSIFLSTTGMDRIENTPSTLYGKINAAYGSALLASDGGINWMILQYYTGNVIVNQSITGTALSYLPLATNSTDIGTSPQTVTTNGTVTYTTIGGKACAYFNNSLNNYLSFPFSNPTNFTVAFRFNQYDGSYYTCVGITNASLSSALQFDLTAATTTTEYTAMPNQWTISPTATIGAAGSWTHIAYTVNQTTYVTQTFVNGTYVTSATGSGTGFASRDRFFLGRSGDNSRAYYGYIRQFTFFNRVLSATEITSLYNATA